jgi:hypothetical protein
MPHDGPPRFQGPEVRAQAQEIRVVAQTWIAQFIAVCSVSILAETLGYAASFSSPLRGKRGVFERCKPVFMDQLQPSTNSDKLSDAL